LSPAPGRWPASAKASLYALANAVLLYLCLAPASALPPQPLRDKVEHALAWAVLTVLGLLFWPRWPGRVVAYAVALGGLIEVLQAALPLGRAGDWRDWAADTVGVAAALVVWVWVRARR
jgi:VanZ family protein